MLLNFRSINIIFSLSYIHTFITTWSALSVRITFHRYFLPRSSSSCTLSGGWSHVREFGYLKSFEIPAEKPESCVYQPGAHRILIVPIWKSTPAGRCVAPPPRSFKTDYSWSAFGNFRFESVSRRWRANPAQIRKSGYQLDPRNFLLKRVAARIDSDCSLFRRTRSPLDDILPMQDVFDRKLGLRRFT